MNQDGYRLLITKKPEFKPEYLFDTHSPEFSDEYLIYQWVKKQKIRASVVFRLDDSQGAISLPRAPFGGIKIQGRLLSEGMDQFISEVVLDLRNRGARKIVITQRPKPYEDFAELIQYLLYKHGFRVDRILNHQFFIGKKKIKHWIKEEGGRFEKKRKEQGIEVDKGPIRNFQFVSKISEWNSLRGYAENLDQNSIVQQVSSFPDRYFELSLRKDEEIIAAALLVGLTPGSLYYYKSGIDPKTDFKQLGDILLHQLFLMAADLKVNFIDLGSSDLDTGANHQLIFFKSRFTNDQYNKISWSLNC